MSADVMSVMAIIESAQSRSSKFPTLGLLVFRLVGFLSMLLCFANRLLGEPVVVSGGEVVVVVEASFEL